MGDHKRRVTPSKIPEGCVALDLSKLQTLDARTAQQVRNAKVLHLVLPRIGEEDYISVLASADVPPLIRGITTAVELFHAGGSFNTELAYPNMEGLWNAMKMRAELIGAALPEQNVAYTTPRIFNAAFESLRSNINCGDYGNAGKRISMLVAALLQSRTN
jgi:hypothetical protein